MQIKVLDRDAFSLRESLRDKKRIMTYGAGLLADSYYKMLQEYGYELDYMITDEAYLTEDSFSDTGWYPSFRLKSCMHHIIPERMRLYG